MAIDYHASNRFISVRLLANELSTNPPEEWAGILAEALAMAPDLAAARQAEWQRVEDHLLQARDRRDAAPSGSQEKSSAHVAPHIESAIGTT